MFSARLVLLVLFIGVLPACTGKTGPAGPNGSNGTTAPNTFEAVFQNGGSPSVSYTGELDTWLNGGAYTTVENASPYLEINTGNTFMDYSRILVRFNVSTLPVNANIVSAELLLTTETQT